MNWRCCLVVQPRVQQRGCLFVLRDGVLKVCVAAVLDPYALVLANQAALQCSRQGIVQQGPIVLARSGGRAAPRLSSSNKR
jgi:hypothetical protein